MFVRILRQRFRFSQEQLAESSGLSLRTIQRVEAGHRISYASLRALAKVFEIDVDKLELELYAMKNTKNEYKELPLWVRLIVGRGFMSSSRWELGISEFIFVGLGILFLGLSIADPSWSIINDPKDSALYASLIMFLSAYYTSIGIRIGDKYSVWQLLGHTMPRKFFGHTEQE